MDLSRIEAWTREMLEAEARRRGIRSCEFRSRGELVRLILRHQYGDRVASGRERIARSVRTMRQARELFGAAVSAGLASLPEPWEAWTRLRPKVPPSPSPSAPSGEHTPPQPERSTPREAPDAEPEPPSPVEAAPPASWPPRSDVREDEDEDESEPVTVREPTASAHSLPPDGPSGTLPPASEPVTRTFHEEPIRTRSMARLLAAQGHRDRAMRIYEELLARDGEDPELRRELDLVRAGRALGEAVPDLDKVAAAFDLPMPSSDDTITCENADRQQLRVRWQVTTDGLARARSVLGHDSELALRVVTIAPDAARSVRTVITEHGPVGTEGRWTAPPLEGESRCFVAVGLRAADRFVAIAHTQV